ncbi:MAG TPA: class II aldolase/adducin family protein [Bacteroidota bacterium]|nr:class II aldolase/adducin family protein [Bacteroidota bacterium]
MEQTRADIARQLVLICHRIYEKGFVTATDGNVSARLANGNILITPSALNKGRVTESDLVEVKADGTPVTMSRKPSTELDMHLFIYRERSDVQAVVHAHPTYATGFATARISLSECLFPEVIVGLGAIPLAQYATPSTREVADALAPFVKKADAILLANHGVVTYGRDLDDAYFKMEKVEHAAHITFVARMLGGEQPLTEEEIKKLRAISGASYGKEIDRTIACEPAENAKQEEVGMSDVELKAFIREVLKEKR